MNKIFLSHDNRDEEIARIIASTFQRITLGNLKFWFSSDKSPYGGMEPGIWFDQLRTRLIDSDVILVLLTKNSLEKHWLYFESGFGEANPQCDVIPLIVGINSFEDIPLPLSLYQAYNLIDLPSLKTFATKLMAKFEIQFDEEMTEPILKKALSDIAKNTPLKEPSDEDNIYKLISDLKSHIDRRFLDLVLPSTENPSKSEYLWETTFYIEPSQILSLEIYSSDTVEDILNAVYYQLDVLPFTYLEEWILKRTVDETYLVIREIASLIPARYIFLEKEEWLVEKLDSPYNPHDSTNRIKSKL